VGLTALTAASFCVFLTLETAATFLAAAVLRTGGFGAGLLALAVAFGFAAAFRATALRAAGLAAVARLAFSLADGLAAAGFALTTRFAVFAGAFFAFERVGDRRKPFVRLLLMGGISKGCSLFASSRWNRAQLTTGSALNQRPQVFAGALSPTNTVHLDKCANKEKHLMHIVGYVKVRLAYEGLKHLGTSPQPNK
jgi:hypothetical protein